MTQTIDLAFSICRERGGRIALLVALFALPGAALSAWCATRFGLGHLAALLAFLIPAPLAGAALVAGVGGWVFGEPLSVRRSLGAAVRRVVPIFLWGGVAYLAGAIGTALLVVPGVLLLSRYQFAAEILLLERLPAARVPRRLWDLSRGSAFALGWRAIHLAAFAVALGVALFGVLEVVGFLAFGAPLMLDTLSGETIWTELSYALSHRPSVAAALCLSLWIAFPVVRTAWFLDYLDTRMGAEGWDISRLATREAERLEGGAS